MKCALRPAAFAVLAALGFFACNVPLATVRQLDESSAKQLIAASLKDEGGYRIPVDNFIAVMGRTLKDYKSSRAENESEATLGRLLGRGLVAQAVDTASYPEISGRFVSEKTIPISDLCYSVWQIYELKMLANSNRITGTSYSSLSATNPTAVTNCGGFGEAVQVTGTVEPDGRVTLEGYFQPRVATYGEEGTVAYLGFQDMRCRGNASHKKVTVKHYTYSWSTEFQKHLVRADGSSYAVGGNFEIGDVTHLRLVTDTEATADFRWTVSLNDVGRLFFPDQPPSGTSGVAFGKRPDGTWFVDTKGTPFKR